MARVPRRSGDSRHADRRRRGRRRGADRAALAAAGVQQPATEIYLAPMKFGPAGPLVGPARNVTENPGATTTSRSSAATAARCSSPRTATASRPTSISSSCQRARCGSSPARRVGVLADGDARRRRGLGDSRRGRRHAAGVEIRRTRRRATVLVPGVKPAGYHAWIDAGQVAVFVLGKPATLQIVEVASGKAETVASDIGRALLRRPTGTITFVHRENGVSTVKEYDPAARRSGALVPPSSGSPSMTPPGGPTGPVHDPRRRGPRLAAGVGGLPAGRRSRNRPVVAAGSVGRRPLDGPGRCRSAELTSS